MRFLGCRFLCECGLSEGSEGNSSLRGLRGCDTSEEERLSTLGTGTTAEHQVTRARCMESVTLKAPDGTTRSTCHVDPIETDGADAIASARRAC